MEEQSTFSKDMDKPNTFLIQMNRKDFLNISEEELQKIIIYTLTEVKEEIMDYYNFVNRKDITSGRNQN